MRKSVPSGFARHFFFSHAVNRLHNALFHAEFTNDFETPRLQFPVSYTHLEDIPFDLPDEWEWCRLSTISEFDLGKTLDRQKNTGNYRKYLRSVNVLWGNIDLSDVKEMRFEDTELERYSIKKGDLLICEGGDVGRCAVWNKDFVFYYQNALHRCLLYTSGSADG